MKTHPSDTSLLLTRIFDAPRDRVFRAWTDPNELRKWWGPAHFSTVVADVDLTVGGKYRLGLQETGGIPVFVSGVYREIQAPERLVYTWCWEQAHESLGETLVTVEFIEQKNKTKVVLIHELFPTLQERDKHKWGWAECLKKLPQAL